MADSNESGELAKGLRQPADWTTDGMGIRGPQTGRASPDADEIRHSDQPIGEVVREAQGGGKSQGVDPQSQSDVDVYGAFNGQPAVFHLLQSSSPTPLE
jgi:hypothetical protein